jgi:PhnB protein
LTGQIEVKQKKARSRFENGANMRYDHVADGRSFAASLNGPGFPANSWQTLTEDTTMSTVKTERTIHPYLFFAGQCEEAINFYRKALGAEIVMLMRYKEAPPGHSPQPMPPDWGGKVMHARIRIGNSTILLADGRSEKTHEVQGFSLSLTVPDAADAEKLFAALSKGGKVEMPLAKTFFSPAFGMVKDPFGILWMVYVEQERP